MTEITPLSVQRAKAGLAQRAAMIAHCEWISLGVLALQAAERAHEEDDAFAENYYITLARKCDACADQLWPIAKGNRSIE